MRKKKRSHMSTVQNDPERLTDCHYVCSRSFTTIGHKNKEGDK